MYNKFSSCSHLSFRILAYEIHEEEFFCEGSSGSKFVIQNSVITGAKRVMRRVRLGARLPRCNNTLITLPAMDNLFSALLRPAEKAVMANGLARGIPDSPRSCRSYHRGEQRSLAHQKLTACITDMFYIIIATCHLCALRTLLQQLVSVDLGTWQSFGACRRDNVGFAPG